MKSIEMKCSSSEIDLPYDYAVSCDKWRWSILSFCMYFWIIKREDGTTDIKEIIENQSNKKSDWFSELIQNLGSLAHNAMSKEDGDEAWHKTTIIEKWSARILYTTDTHSHHNVHHTKFVFFPFPHLKERLTFGFTFHLCLQNFSRNFFISSLFRLYTRKSGQSCSHVWGFILCIYVCVCALKWRVCICVKTYTFLSSFAISYPVDTANNLRIADSKHIPNTHVDFVRAPRNRKQQNK